MKPLKSIPACFVIERQCNDARRVTIRTQDGVTMVYYVDTVEIGYETAKRDYEYGMMDKEQRNHD